MTVFHSLINDLARMPGVQRIGCIRPGRKVLLPNNCPPEEAKAQESTWLAVADTFNLFTLHRLPSDELRWNFGEQSLHCINTGDFMVAFFAESDLISDLAAAVGERLQMLLQRSKDHGQ